MTEPRDSGIGWIVAAVVFAVVVIGSALYWVNRTPEPTSAAKAAAVAAKTAEKPADSGGTSTSGSTSTSGDSAPKIIERSDRVANLQRELKKLGFYTGAIDGVYGPSTMDAVKKLQTEVGVTPDGVFGPKTAEAAVAHGYFKQSETVMSMQVALKSLGYYDGEVNGNYDVATEKAIKAFQKDHNIKVDGFFSPEMGSELEKALNQ